MLVSREWSCNRVPDYSSYVTLTSPLSRLAERCRAVNMNCADEKWQYKATLNNQTDFQISKTSFFFIHFQTTVFQFIVWDWPTYLAVECKVNSGILSRLCGFGVFFSLHVIPCTACVVVVHRVFCVIAALLFCCDIWQHTTTCSHVI